MFSASFIRTRKDVMLALAWELHPFGFVHSSRGSVSATEREKSSIIINGCGAMRTPRELCWDVPTGAGPAQMSWEWPTTFWLDLKLALEALPGSVGWPGLRPQRAINPTTLLEGCSDKPSLWGSHLHTRTLLRLYAHQRSFFVNISTLIQRSTTAPNTENKRLWTCQL